MDNTAQNPPDGNKPEGSTTHKDNCQTASQVHLPAVRPPRTDFEERLIRTTLYVVMCIAMAMWCCLLPIWWYDILCLVPRIAWQQVRNIYHHGEPAMTDQLERVLLFWPRGFFALLEIRNGGTFKPQPLIETKGQLLLKSLFAAGFYTVLFFTGAVAKWCADAGFSLMWLGWHLLFSVAKATLI